MAKAKGEALPKDEQKLLSRVVARDGEAAVVAQIDCSRQTLYRAMAGLPIYPGTAALIRERVIAAEAKGRK